MLHQNEHRSNFVREHVCVGGRRQPLASQRHNVQSIGKLVEEVRVALESALREVGSASVSFAPFMSCRARLVLSGDETCRAKKFETPNCRKFNISTQVCNLSHFCCAPNSSSKLARAKRPVGGWLFAEQLSATRNQICESETLQGIRHMRKKKKKKKKLKRARKKLRNC